VERPQLRKAVGGGPGASGAAVLAWVLYDFANTIFVVTVLSLFFPLWVEERVGDGAFFSAPGLVNGAAAVSALLVVFSAPVLGAATGYRLSIGSLAVIMAAGIYFLMRVPDARPGGAAPLDSPAARAEDVGR
jgi:MFS-type transporter involved in bile tolerance (Atg22 family)